MLRGAVHFILVFGAGFILGTFRVLWLAPQIGERLAELVEAPFILVVVFFSARFVTQRFPASRRAHYLGSGGLALLLLLVAESAVVLGLRGLTISQYLAERDTVAGGVYAFMLMVFAAMPWLVGNRHSTT